MDVAFIAPSAIRQPWTPASNRLSAGSPMVADTTGFLTTDGASISADALRAAETATVSAEPRTSHAAKAFAGLALALALAGGLSGCATMGGPGTMPTGQSQSIQENPTILNGVGRGTHEIINGVGDIGRGIGHWFRDRGREVRDGWQSVDQPQAPVAHPQQAPAAAPKAPVQVAHPRAHR